LTLFALARGPQWSNLIARWWLVRMRAFAMRIGKWNDVGKSRCTDGNRR
jgi:hypothetical protein